MSSPRKNPFVILLTIICLVSPCFADKVVMKDGTVYQGKILVDTEKYLVIGNPPYETDQYMLHSQDIDTIVYEEYHHGPPSERRRGFVAEGLVSSHFFSSNELSLNDAPGLLFIAGFRVHPILELDGGLTLVPQTSASSGGLTVSDGTLTRRYEKFSLLGGSFLARIYPCAYKKWRLEPYVTGGYQLVRLGVKGSDDKLKGDGWAAGAGAIYPITTHFFLNGQLLYQGLTFDRIVFQGKDGDIKPEISEKDFTLSLGVSYRL